MTGLAQNPLQQLLPLLQLLRIRQGGGGLDPAQQRQQQFQQLRTGVGGNALSSGERNVDRYRRGTADATFGNIAKAISFGLGIASGTGPLKLGAKAALGALMGEKNPGMPDFEGFVGPNPAGTAAVKAGTRTAAQQQGMDRKAKEMRDALLSGSPSRAAMGGPMSRGGGGRSSVSLGRDSSAKKAGTTGAPGVY